MQTFFRDSLAICLSLQYEKYVLDISTLVTGELINNFGLIAQLAASITSASRLSKSRFPYFTNSEFEISGGSLEGMSGMYSVAFAPLVPAENQTDWERYSVNNQNWLLEGALLRQIHPDHIDPMSGTFQDSQHRNLQGLDVQDLISATFKFSDISETVYSMQDGEKVPYEGANGETLAPVWQMAPTPYDDPKMVNYNALSDPVVSGLFDVIKKQRETVMSQSFQGGYLFDHVFKDE